MQQIRRMREEEWRKEGRRKNEVKALRLPSSQLACRSQRQAWSLEVLASGLEKRRKGGLCREHTLRPLAHRSRPLQRLWFSYVAMFVLLVLTFSPLTTLLSLLCTFQDAPWTDLNKLLHHMPLLSEEKPRGYSQKRNKKQARTVWGLFTNVWGEKQSMMHGHSDHRLPFLQVLGYN